MSEVEILPLAVYPADTYPIPATAIADNVTEIRASFQRCMSSDPTVWPNPADTISYDFDVSVDGGPFQDFIAGEDSGGITKNKLGVEIPFMDLGDNLPPGINRRIQGTVTTSAAIKTRATVTVT